MMGEYELTANELLITLRNEMNFSLMELIFKFGRVHIYEFIHN